MESEPVFNAGRGAKLQFDGKARLDASIMKSDLDAGAVIGMEENIENPISVARKIMEKTHHVALKGRQATHFAREFGFNSTETVTEQRKRANKKFQEKAGDLDFREKVRKLKELEQTGTVGAVAIDRKGRMAAATSTGGRYGQMAGRIGDTPMPGNGTYCNSEAAVSATGVGEAIIKTTLSRRTAENIEKGMEPEKATRKALEFLENKTGRSAGLITIDKKGGMGSWFNTDAMVWTERELS